MCGSSSLCSSTSTTTLSIALANSVGSSSRASPTRSSNSDCDMCTAIHVSPVLRTAGRRAATVGVRGDTARRRGESAAVVQRFTDLAVDLGGTRLPALLLHRVPAEHEPLVQPVVVGVGGQLLVALLVQPLVLLLRIRVTVGEREFSGQIERRDDLVGVFGAAFGGRADRFACQTQAGPWLVHARLVLFGRLPGAAQRFPVGCGPLQAAAHLSQSVVPVRGGGAQHGQ